MVRVELNCSFQQPSSGEGIEGSELDQPLRIQPRGFWIRRQGSPNHLSIAFRCLCNPELPAQPVSNPRNELENVALGPAITHYMRVSSGCLLQPQVHSKLLIRHQKVGAENNKVRVDQLSNALQGFRAVGWTLRQIQVALYLGDGFTRNHEQALTGAELRYQHLRQGRGQPCAFGPLG